MPVSFLFVGSFHFQGSEDKAEFCMIEKIVLFAKTVFILGLSHCTRT